VTGTLMLLFKERYLGTPKVCNAIGNFPVSLRLILHDC